MRAVLRRLADVKDTDPAWHYNKIIATAGVPLLCSLEREIFNNTRNMMDKYLARIWRRMEFSTMSTDRLWGELLAYAEEHRNHYTTQFDYHYGLDLVEALAHKGDFNGEDVIEYLEDDETFHGYDEIYLINLVGQLKTQAAVPVLVDKLRVDGDLTCEEAVAALVKIGTDDAVRSVREVFLREEWSFRNYATGVLTGTSHRPVNRPCWSCSRGNGTSGSRPCWRTG